LIVEVICKPRSSESKIEKIDDFKYRAYLRRSPTDNQANSELISALSRHFKVAKSLIAIIVGKKNRRKRIQIDD